ncbi:MAG: hypothetical protein Q4F29_09055 [Lachnospiraceae bacterium]|nr:hypothetical protein [Lachnospiraceae bacterium]
MIKVIGILLLILKIIWWILLGILGLILGILLFVLFSAVRYRIDGRKDGDAFGGTVRVTWLLWILSVQAVYRDGLDVAVKVFGRTVWRLGEDGASESEEPEESGTGPDEPEKGSAGPDGPDELAEDFAAPSEKSRPELSAESSENPQPESSGKSSGNPQPEASGKASENPQPEAFAGPEKEEPSREKLRFPEKIRAFFEKLKFSFQSICGKLEQTKEKADGIQTKASELLEKWEVLQDYLHNPANQKSARLIFRQLKKILCCLLPKKGHADITFGLEDPYQMGQVLSAASMAYPFVHRVLDLHPVFGEKILEGEIHVRGHLRLGIILGYVLRLLLDGNIRKQLWRKIHPAP